MGVFAREERFIVVKRKHLDPHQEQGLRGYLRACGVETSECVVVESDWPEYETVWKMIEARCTGHLPASDSTGAAKLLEAILAEARMANDVVKLNRDGGGQGRVKVATSMHRIERFAAKALSQLSSDDTEGRLKEASHMNAKPTPSLGGAGAK